ncbi:DUF5988 family protein [Streptomyces vinaceus]|uniref:DUF5988 family protein n=1 Tax=Streptomyces vinaceus TaxID=1960 RepID=UPI0037F7126F
MNGPRAFLEGGPDDVPERYAIPDADPDRLRVPRLGGYEHYEFTGTHRPNGDDGDLPVYRWIYRTRIAE